MALIRSSCSPGPGAYGDGKSLVGSEARHQQTMGFWRDIPARKCKTPGPGRYETMTSQTLTGGGERFKYSMKSRHPLLAPSNADTPGPGSYKAQSSMSKTFPRPRSSQSNWSRSDRFNPKNARFSVSKNPFMDNTNSYHDQRSRVLKTLSKNESISLNRTSNMLGPGRYNKTHTLTSRKPQKFSFGHKTVNCNSSFATSTNSAWALTPKIHPGGPPRQRKILN